MSSSNLRAIKQRRSVISSIYKITSSMEVITKTKTNKELKLFNETSKNSLNFLESINYLYAKVFANPKYKAMLKTSKLVIAFFSDLGLVGGFNSFIMKELKQIQFKNDDYLIVIGKKGKMIASSFCKNFYSFSNLEFQTEKVMLEISQLTSELMANGYEVEVIFTEYYSQLSFNSIKRKIFPIFESEQKFIQKAIEKKYNAFEIENLESFFTNSLLIYANIIFNFFWRHSQISENTSRRIAMENATKNCEDIFKNLTIEYNRTRQAKITQEIIEVIGGSTNE